MKDMQAQLEKLHTQCAECELIRDPATDPIKRETFDKLAKHFRTLANEVQNAMTRLAANQSKLATTPDTFLGRQMHKPFPKEEE